MVNIFKLILYIKKVGLKQFKEEYNNKKEEQMLDGKTILKGQIFGLWVSLLFSLASTVLVLVFNKNLWTLAGIFVGGSIMQYFQLQGFYSQLTQMKAIEALQAQIVEQEDNNESSNIL